QRVAVVVVPFTTLQLLPDFQHLTGLVNDALGEMLFEFFLIRHSRGLPGAPPPGGVVMAACYHRCGRPAGPSCGPVLNMPLSLWRLRYSETPAATLMVSGGRTFEIEKDTCQCWTGRIASGASTPREVPRLSERTGAIRCCSPWPW